MTYSRNLKTLSLVLVTLVFSACGGGSNSIFTPLPTPVVDITLEGSVFDGPVSGGSLYIFSADTVNQAISDANDAADRAASLASASPIATLARDVADGDAFTIPVSGDLANQALFLVFDSEGAGDATFGDQPFNMEAAVVAGAAGSTLQINLSPHTTLTAIQVRALLDPDGDGIVIDAAAIQSAIDIALANAKSTFGESSLGEALFPGDEDPQSTTDLDVLETASSEVGLAIRTAAVMNGLSMDEVMYLFAADAADGVLDGSAPVSFGLTVDEDDDLAMISDTHSLGLADANDMEAVNCTSASNSLRRACEFEALDEFFVGVATCAHSNTEEDAAACVDDYRVDRDDLLDECGEVTAARHELCAATDDAAHNPPFGLAFAADFVDPLTIGDTTPANPFTPLVQGNVWKYEGTFMEDGEEITEVITVTVTNRTKLIDGITCLVVRDVVEIDGQLIEDTDDWFAQDTDGNVWYCGEEVKDYEWFDGDVPAVPELVAIDGSFKAGRDGDEAGMLIPFAPVVGDIHRQEVSFTNAEDAVEILALDGSEIVPAASCDGTCLITMDFSPLDPGVEEHKYYAPGIGMILEVDVDTGDRVELIELTTAL